MIASVDRGTGARGGAERGEGELVDRTFFSISSIPHTRCITQHLKAYFISHRASESRLCEACRQTPRGLAAFPRPKSRWQEDFLRLCLSSRVYERRKSSSPALHKAADHAKTTRNPAKMRLSNPMGCLPRSADARPVPSTSLGADTPCLPSCRLPSINFSSAQHSEPTSTHSTTTAEASTVSTRWIPSVNRSGRISAKRRPFSRATALTRRPSRTWQDATIFSGG